MHKTIMTLSSLLLTVLLKTLSVYRHLSLDEIHTAYKAVAGEVSSSDPFIFGPTIDGVEATVHPWIAAANGDVNKVPIMFGTNRDEGSMFCDLQKDATMDDLHDYWNIYDVDAAGQEV